MKNPSCCVQHRTGIMAPFYSFEEVAKQWVKFHTHEEPLEDGCFIFWDDNRQPTRFKVIDQEVVVWNNRNEQWMRNLEEVKRIGIQNIDKKAPSGNGCCGSDANTAGTNKRTGGIRTPTSLWSCRYE